MITLRNHEIYANIKDRYADIVYSFDFENMNEFGSNELRFEVTIDPNAFISRFEANIDGEIFVGITKEKQSAAKEYNEAKEDNLNTILISQPHTNIPNVFLIQTNIDSKSKILLTIQIEQYLQKKCEFNIIDIQILRNFNKYNIKQNFNAINFKLNIEDMSGIYDIHISMVNPKDIVIGKHVLDKMSQKCEIHGKILTSSTLNELILKYKIKGEQNDSHILFDNNSNTFCHIISDILSDSIIINDTDDEGKHDELRENILIPRRVMFVIDRSGSMAGSKWEKTISSTVIAIKQLRKGYDRFGIILFDSAIQLLPYNHIRGCLLANDKNISDAIKALQNAKTGGSTNINDALLKAIELIKMDILLLNNDECCQHNFFVNQIIFITDGAPNNGERNPTKIVTNINNANDLSKIDKYHPTISLFSFGIGKDGNDSAWIHDLNHSFLKILSLNNNGFYHRIRQNAADSALTQYFNILSKPCFSNIAVEYKDQNKTVSDLTNTKFPVLYFGTDLIICGKINNSNMLSLTIKAITGKQMKQNDKFITTPVSISKEMKIDISSHDNDNANNAERIWAYLKLRQFVNEKLLYNDMVEIDANEQKEKESVPLKLALKYKFVTPWTSMIVVKKTKQKLKKPPLQPAIESITNPSDGRLKKLVDAPEFIPTPRGPSNKERQTVSNADADWDYFGFNVEDVMTRSTIDYSILDQVGFKKRRSPTSSRAAPRSLSSLSHSNVAPPSFSNFSSATPSKETLAKVATLKKRVESTTSARLSNVNQRRLRRLRTLGRESSNVVISERDLMSATTAVKQASLNDFTLMGKCGTFGELILVKHKKENMIYAMKKIQQHIIVKRAVIVSADSPFLIKIHFSIREDGHLYLIMDHYDAGSLMHLLMKHKALTQQETKFYIAQLVYAINAVHELDYVHRDLAPTNILITSSGHIKLCDFGIKGFVENDKIMSKCKEISGTDSLNALQFEQNVKFKYGQRYLAVYGFIRNIHNKEYRVRDIIGVVCNYYHILSSINYIAPETLRDRGYDKMVDFWSIGIIMFECLVGYPPFYSNDPLQICRKIIHYRKYFKITSDILLSKNCKGLIFNLVCSNRRRYGFNQIKSHPFFKGIDWNNLMSLKPPFLPL